MITYLDWFKIDSIGQLLGNGWDIDQNSQIASQTILGSYLLVEC